MCANEKIKRNTCISQSVLSIRLIQIDQGANYPKCEACNSAPAEAAFQPILSMFEAVSFMG